MTPIPVSYTHLDVYKRQEYDSVLDFMAAETEPQKYTGKTVKFLAQVCQTNRAGKDVYKRQL